MKNIWCVAVLAIAACGSNSGGTSSGTATGATGATSGTTGHTSTGGSSSGSSLFGTSCDISSGIDPCVGGGFACSADLAGGTQGTCVLPQAEQQCLSAVGCQDGGKALKCQGNLQNGSGMTVSLCVPTCAPSADCTDPNASCQAANVGGQKVCLGNTCGAPYYGSCNSTGTSDGQCLSFSGGQFGECFQTGTAVAGASCSYDRGGAAPQCVAGEMCVPGGNGAFTNPGVCMVLTDGSPDSGHPCANNMLFAPLQGSDWAICPEGCDAGSCSAGFMCVPNGSLLYCAPTG